MIVNEPGIRIVSPTPAAARSARNVPAPASPLLATVNVVADASDGIAQNARSATSPTGNARRRPDRRQRSMTTSQLDRSGRDMRNNRIRFAGLSWAGEDSNLRPTD